jgi:Flp pilus assembly protein TadG
MVIAKRRRAGKGRTLLGGFRRNHSGGAASEFSVILPFALILFTGAITYSTAIYIDRKVTLTARTVTDLVTQYQTIPQPVLQSLLGASSSIMAPYPATNVVVTVSELTTDASGVAKVVWSQATPNGTKRPVGQVVTLPASIDNANVTYIFGEVQYVYTPSIGYQVTGPITLSDQTYMSPRLSSNIPCTGGC